MFLNKVIEEKGVSTDFPIFENKNFCIVEIPTNDLVLAQFKNNTYNAMDIIVKYLAIENYYGKNNFGFKLYNKMQEKRVNENWEQRYKELIKNVEKNGFNIDYPIETDINYSIHDGAHRLALALYYGLENVTVKAYNIDMSRRTYDMEWFNNNSFSIEELKIIKEKYKEIFEKINQPYYCVLWTPARNVFDKIEKEIPNVEDGIKVVDDKNLVLSKDVFKKFMYDIYFTDDILQYKLDMKYNYLINSITKDNLNQNQMALRLVKVLIDNPDFRMKTFTGLPQSKKTMRIKKDIRAKNSEFITDYYYDIIMHMTDNTIQNKDVEKILKKI